ncbi:hypoxia up-regulated protein 1 [Platysternon megacephalum]|uniref:Hypoxia up-regulated protein 1 n=1 Tax=Platysternon megacephalum TaxID=55544 RepID=A0A4D9DWF4_9SAUR|nr:hypoxia up-regulated protein 1 [Platysternon megacephalum]
MMGLFGSGCVQLEGHEPLSKQCNTPPKCSASNTKEVESRPNPPLHLLVITWAPIDWYSPAFGWGPKVALQQHSRAPSVAPTGRETSEGQACLAVRWRAGT